MIRVLLDQGLAPRGAALLRLAGCDAIAPKTLNFWITRDKNAGHASRSTTMALSCAGEPSVVRLRVQRVAAEGQAQLIRSIYQVCEEAIAAGAALSADETSIRVRRLPLR